MNDTKFCLVTSNYPPDIGGPAKFASTFPAMLRGIMGSVISTTSAKSQTLHHPNYDVLLVSRQLSIFPRTLKIIWNIWIKTCKGNTKVIANGFFIETFVACLLTNKRFVAKIPGDLIWEKAKNAKITNSSIVDFQNQSLPLKYKVLQKLNHLAIRNASSVICPTAELARLAITWGAESKKVFVIPNSVDTDRFGPSSKVSRNFDVICVNRLVEWKGMKEVISCCSRLNLSLAIAGTGPLYDELVTFSQNIGARVDFLGDVKNEDLVSYLNDSRMYVLNSTYEATAYSLLEAMSCGLASVARLKTGSEDVIQQNVDGLLVGGTEYPSLLDALRVLKNDSEFGTKIGLEARNSVIKRFDMKKNYKSIERVLLNEV